VNHVILIGRLTGTPEVVKTENDVSRTVINLAVQRTYKNQDGLYETDFLRLVLWNGIADRACEYCKKGDVVCIRGRLQVRNYLDEDGKKKFITEVIVETISFVSSTKAIDKENEKES